MLPSPSSTAFSPLFAAARSRGSDTFSSPKRNPPSELEPVDAGAHGQRRRLGRTPHSPLGLDAPARREQGRNDVAQRARGDVPVRAAQVVAIRALEAELGQLRHVAELLLEMAHHRRTAADQHRPLGRAGIDSPAPVVERDPSLELERTAQATVAIASRALSGRLDVQVRGGFEIVSHDESVDGPRIERRIREQRVDDERLFRRGNAQLSVHAQLLQRSRMPRGLEARDGMVQDEHAAGENRKRLAQPEPLVVALEDAGQNDFVAFAAEARTEPPRFPVVMDERPVEALVRFDIVLAQDVQATAAHEPRHQRIDQVDADAERPVRHASPVETERLRAQAVDSQQRVVRAADQREDLAIDGIGERSRARLPRHPRPRLAPRAVRQATHLERAKHEVGPTLALGEVHRVANLVGLLRGVGRDRARGAGRTQVIEALLPAGGLAGIGRTRRFGSVVVLPRRGIPVVGIPVAGDVGVAVHERADQLRVLLLEHAQQRPDVLARAVLLERWARARDVRIGLVPVDLDSVGRLAADARRRDLVADRQVANAPIARVGLSADAGASGEALVEWAKNVGHGRGCSARFLVKEGAGGIRSWSSANPACSDCG